MVQTEPEPASTDRRIYAAAVELFCERGYHGTSLRDIAGAAGIQLSTFYYHFPSKQSLLAAIMERTMADLTQDVRDGIDGVGTPLERLRRAIRTHVHFHAERRMEALITDSELRALEPDNRERIVAARDRYEQIYRELIRDARLPVTDERLAIYGLMSMCTGVAVWFRPAGRLSIDAVADYFVDLFLYGAGAGEPQA